MSPASAAPSATGSHAIAYARQGYLVLPCRPDKRPYTDHGLLDASTDPDQVRAWWTRWPDAQVGIDCGRSGIVVVDLDVGDDVDGPAMWEMLRGAEPHGATLVVTTPRGGRHYVYSAGGAEYRTTASVVATGIDTRAQGGYVVVPSPASPGRECIEGDWLDLAPGDLAPPPAWLRERLPLRSPPVDETGAPPPAADLGDILDGVAEGSRNGAAARVAGKLLAHGLRAESWPMLVAWNQRNRPPLGEDELRRVYESVARGDRARHPERHVDASEADEFIASFAGAHEAPQTEDDPERQAEDAADARVPFPLDALPPACRAIVEHGAASQGVDVAYWAVPLLSILAGCIGNTRRVRTKRGWVEPAVLWSAVIAPSGAGKSPPLDALSKPVREVDYRLHVMTVAAQQTYASDLESWKAGGCEGPKPEAPPMRASMVDDVTLEALAVRLADNPRGLLLAVDELAGWLKSQNKYRAGSDEQSWLSIHAARPIKVDRKGGVQRVYVLHASVSITGTIQPSIARKYLGDPESCSRGTTARLLLAAPPVVAAKWSDREVPQQVHDEYGRVVRSLLDLGVGEDGDPVTLPLEEDALDEFVEFHDVNGEACHSAATEGDETLAAALSKLRGAAPRLALVFALAEAAEEGRAAVLASVGIEHMRAGIAVAQWCESEARRIYGSWEDAEASERAGRDQRTAAALDKRLIVLLAKLGAPTLDELHDATHHNLRGDVLRASLERLRHAGWAHMTRTVGPRGGRPRETWTLIAPGVSP